MREHWEHAYRQAEPDRVGWYQSHPSVSLKWIDAACAGDQDAAILDAGGGASLLVDHLLEAGYRNITVADVAQAALDQTEARLHKRFTPAQWCGVSLVRADLRHWRPERKFALWHDRAVFHFLMTVDDRHAYLETLRHSLDIGGTLIIATFASDGPERCSGLPVRRYDEDGLSAVLGRDFHLQEHRRSRHVTPSGREQRYLFCRFTRKAPGRE